MAYLPKSIPITIEIEPIVKVFCQAIKCKNNLMWTTGKVAACNLKHITIKENGACVQFEPAEVYKK